MKKIDPIDHAVGIVVHHKVGDNVERGMPSVHLHANGQKQLEEARELALSAYRWQDQPADSTPAFL